jgi:hypothetical protein
MMTRFMSAEMLLALAFIRSGLHTLTLESVRLYGVRMLPELEKRTGCGWVLQWSNRYLEEVRAGFVEIDEDCAMLTTDVDGLGKVLDFLPNDLIEAAEQVEWEE